MIEGTSADIPRDAALRRLGRRLVSGLVTRHGPTVPAILALVTSLAFLPALRNDFVVWDDGPNLTQNLQYRGLGWEQLRWMFTTVRGGHYVPLTWLSFGLDYVLWGMNPIGYHVTNLLLHVATALLFYVLARDLIRRASVLSEAGLTLAAATSALFFAIHPLRVESVAWATERRDVLSGGLFLLTILLYIRASDTRGPRRRWLLSLSVGAYLLALASKSIVMTLPLILLLLDVYPLGRLAGSPRSWFSRSRHVLWEKVSYLILAGAGSIMSYLAQAVLKGPSTPYSSSPWSSRAANVVYSLWLYPLKTAIPAGLSPLYEAPPHIDPWEARFIASAAGVLAVSVLTWLLRARWPAGLAVWIYYGMVLAPVSGVIPMGSQLAADRYSYLACLGWALLVGAAAGAGVDAWRGGGVRPSLAALAAIVGTAGLLGLGALTWRQVGIWRDTETLWRAAVTVSPDCVLCHRSLGEALLQRGAALSALEQFLMAAALRPDAVGLRTYVGVAFARLNMWAEAAGQYRRVLERYPDRVDVRTSLAVALHAMGREREAVEQLREAERIGPDEPDVRLVLGSVLNDLGEYREAADQLQKVIALRPGSAAARLGLLKAYAGLGRGDLARRQYEALRALDPDLAASAELRSLVNESEERPMSEVRKEEK